MRYNFLSLLFSSSLLPATTACQVGPVVPEFDQAELLPGGEGSVGTVPFPSSELPARNLPQEERPDFFAGKALAHQPWVKAPTITDARDGLGPLYNARTCLACHFEGGRGHIADDSSTPLISSILRLSVPGQDEKQGAVPEPNYGSQLQTQSTDLSHQLKDLVDVEIEAVVPAEAEVRVEWAEDEFVYPDGLAVALRHPNVMLNELGYGALAPNVLTSLRVAPPIHGMGLIELIPQAEIDLWIDEDDADADGISGRANWVWDVRSQKSLPGRFGYKANQSTLEQAVAAAFSGDLGISSSLFPDQPCSPSQVGCLRELTGNNEDGLELPDDLLELVVNFNRNLGVPQRSEKLRESTMSGRRFFYELGCSSCHRPSYRTSANQTQPHLGEQLIWPYSDFLIHDMGESLSDHRPDYQARGSEWRTTPLWGLGVSAEVSGEESYLHDGRARTIEEAILWHGGEAGQARERFTLLNAEERQNLIDFLGSL
ncbi:MAG: thiol oxidoreductase [Polyangiaceae bacterium]|nr:thiol oxidoreductase [Polyangiaceae bacterium]